MSLHCRRFLHGLRSAASVGMHELLNITIVFTEWCQDQGIELRFIEPGKPDQNACIERFNKTYREEVLSACVFESLEQIREITEFWLREYNQERPHESLGRVPPLTYMPRQAWEANIA
jgi:putative transposase